MAGFEALITGTIALPLWQQAGFGAIILLFLFLAFFLFTSRQNGHHRDMHSRANLAAQLVRSPNEATWLRGILELLQIGKDLERDRNTNALLKIACSILALASAIVAFAILWGRWI